MNKQVSKKGVSFWKVLAIASGSFLILVGIGLVIFWNFIDAFEFSRPQRTIADYMESMTVEQLVKLDKETMKRLDADLQNETDMVAYAENELQKITYAKNTKLSTDSKQVYMILSAGKRLGSVSMTVTSSDAYGFERWAVTETDIDVSFLMGETVSVTVPSQYKVYANGVLLDDRYITDFDIPYDGVKEYYRKYELPTLCTYTTKPVFGTPQLMVTDAAGNVLSPEQLAQACHIPDNCSDSKKGELREFLDEFLYHYLRFTMGAGGQGKLYHNYNLLKPYIRRDSTLSLRLEDSLEGLAWVLDRKAEMRELTVHAIVDLGDGHYLCDFSYVVDARTYEGPMRNEANVKLIIDDTNEGLKAESMTNY